MLPPAPCGKVLIGLDTASGVMEQPKRTGSVPIAQRGQWYAQRMAASWCCGGKEGPWCAFRQAQMHLRGMRIGRQQLVWCSHMLDQPDDVFLQLASTSPQHEAATFVEGVRQTCACQPPCATRRTHFTAEHKAAMRWILQHAGALLDGLPARALTWDAMRSDWVDTTVDDAVLDTS